MSAPTISQPTQTPPPTPEIAGEMFFPGEHDQPPDGYRTATLGHEAVVGAEPGPSTRPANDPSLVTEYTPGRQPGVKYYTEPPPRDRNRQVPTLTAEERAALDPSMEEYLVHLEGAQAPYLPPDYVARYGEYILSLGIGPAELPKTDPAENPTVRGNTEAYDNDHNEFYRFPSTEIVSDYLRSPNAPSNPSRPGVETIDEAGRLVRHIKLEDLRASIVSTMRGSESQDDNLISHQIVSYLERLTSHPDHNVKIYTSLDELAQISSWEDTFCTKHPDRGNLQITLADTNDAKNKEMIRGKRFGPSPSTEVPDALARAESFWRLRKDFRKIYDQTRIETPLRPLTINYGRLVEIVNSKINGDFNKFNAVFSRELLALQLGSDVVIRGPQEEFARSWGYAWEQDSLSFEARNKDRLSAMGIELGNVTLTNSDIATNEAPHLIELHQRARGSEQLRGRKESDGSYSLVFLDDDEGRFANSIGLLAKTTGKSFDETMVDLLIGKQEQGYRIIGHLKRYDYWHPERCGWRQELVSRMEKLRASAQKARASVGTLKIIGQMPDPKTMLMASRRFEMIVIDSTRSNEQMLQTKHPSIRPLSPLLGDRARISPRHHTNKLPLLHKIRPSRISSDSNTYTNKAHERTHSTKGPNSDKGYFVNIENWVKAA